MQLLAVEGLNDAATRLYEERASPVDVIDARIAAHVAAQDLSTYEAERRITTRQEEQK
jgi:hypothetical protein